LKRRKETEVAPGTLCLAELVTPASWRRDTRLTLIVTVTRANDSQHRETRNRQRWLRKRFSER
jgi:hypothetical protein